MVNKIYYIYSENIYRNSDGKYQIWGSIEGQCDERENE